MVLQKEAMEIERQKQIDFEKKNYRYATVSVLKDQMKEHQMKQEEA